MKPFKLAAIFLAAALAACSRTPAPKPVQTAQPTATAIFSLKQIVVSITSQKLEFLPKNNPKAWVLNGAAPSVFFIGDPFAKQAAPEEYVHIYIFKDAKEREKAIEDFNGRKTQSNTAAPILWQNGNALVLYWHSAPAGKKAAFEEKIGEALAGWEMKK